MQQTRLPSIPGRGLIRMSDGSLTRFRAAYASYRIDSQNISDTEDDCGVSLSEALAAALGEGTSEHPLR